MASLQLHHETATNDEIPACCSNPNRILLGGAPYGNKVIKSCDKAVVKFGRGVMEEEAENQRRAYELIDHDVVRVPLVYHSFFKEQRGYIVMEYMEGRVLETVEDPSLRRRIVDILAHLTKIRGSIPGALSRGVSCGILWCESEPTSFNTIKDLEAWFNRRSAKNDPRLLLDDYELGLCHLDIAPRNFILLQDGSICLVDWASARFYPRLFEVCVFQITHRLKDSFVSDALPRGDLTDREEVHLQTMLQAHHNSVRFYL